MRKVQGMALGMRLYPSGGQTTRQCRDQDDFFVRIGAFFLHKSFVPVLFWGNERETPVWGMVKTPEIVQKALSGMVIALGQDGVCVLVVRM